MVGALSPPIGRTSEIGAPGHPYFLAGRCWRVPPTRWGLGLLAHQMMVRQRDAEIARLKGELAVFAQERRDVTQLRE